MKGDLPPIISLDEAIEGLANHKIYIHIEQQQIIDWLKELRNYKEADGTLQADSDILHEMLKTEFEKMVLILDDKSMQKVLREISDEKILLAAKNSPDEVWNKFLQNMSKRKQKMMLEDREYLRIFRDFDIPLSQRIILSIIYHLIDTGEISLPKPVDDIDERICKS